MIKLYLKTISASLLILFFILLGFYLSFTYSIRVSAQKVHDILGIGNFSVLEHLLLKSNESQWNRSNEELKKLFPQNINAAQVIAMNSLPLTEKEKEQLLAGGIVYKDEQNLMFLTYSLHDVYAYKRLNKSAYVLKIQVGTSMNEIIQSSTYLMRALILNTLNTTPLSKWNEALDKLRLQYQIPLTLTSINSNHITYKTKNKLMNGEVDYDIPTDEKPITTIYFKIPNSDKIIRVGPLNYPYFSLQLSKIQIYFVITITLLAVFAVAVLTWLFSRNSAKIHKLTQEYSQGHFNYDVNLNRFSTLRGVYENVVAMGNKINLLMQSQQNMARFVAHEVRTPLYTIQLALDSLKKLKTQSSEEQEHIESIEEDIQELNRLIHTFLLYSQSTSHELKINREQLNLRQWLANLLKTHQSYEVNVSFNYQQSDNEFISFDPKLLYHAVTNLISNALKHARKEILIRLEYQNESVIIHIEDDGPGVPEQDREKIVEPFTTLNSGDTTGKHIGLGLSITKSILSLHDGMLAISDSKILKGASFSLIFPRIT
ncbi:ATP-binding protein [Legionella anisa]|uniref:histidine kinase n=1 Tax=Legionella anisa TaxID=28082 RepID=A0AAX0WW11_9GAMM|nr:ATP-binding protein [Legionella anisa]AWN73497.1 two-component sensor histidine kinase [Legionella anisa]KTC70802.1 sensor histidine kinase CpxA [Legionella anisa]MBN5935359.1 two-component sensor histidine kinase [Legionella anisa]MCW8426372.1 ATP-binding protein [Legionella anisa]MCW8448032.1 ATP-binding protein [Legionella anisa]